MNDRQRLEAILSVVCKYLPPDGISKDQAMTEIIGLVDPLPEHRKHWIELTRGEIESWNLDNSLSILEIAWIVEKRLRELNEAK